MSIIPGKSRRRSGISYFTDGSVVATAQNNDGIGNNEHL